MLLLFISLPPLVLYGLGLVVALVMILNVRERFRYRGYKLPPIVNSWIPFVGSGISFATGPPLKFATDCYKQYGPVFTLGMFGKRMTFLVGPDAQHDFFSKGDDELSQDEPYRFSVPIFGDGVVYGAPPKIRMQQLKFISKALRSNSLRSYVPKIVKETEDFFDAWDDEGTVNLKEALSELIILTASRCLMGDEVRERMFRKVAGLYNTLDEGLTPLSVFFPYAPIPAHRRRDEARLAMCDIFSSIMKERRENPDVPHDDLLQVFMDSSYKDGTHVSDQQVTGLMIALLFAGQHTSSVVSTWTGLLLLKNKEEFFETVMAEQRSVLDAHHGKLTFEGLANMKVLHCCMKEALRLYPPLIFVMRQVIEPFYCGEYYIPKDDILFVSTALGMRVGDGDSGASPPSYDGVPTKFDCDTGDGVYSRPDKYDPLRFMADRAEDKKKKFSFLGFGGGKHGCVGEQFAYVQVKTIWSTLLRNFDLELIGPLPEPDYKAMVVGPKSDGCVIRYRRKVPKAK